MFDLDAIQSALTEFEIDGWLLYDFRGTNVFAGRILDMDPDHIGSRRYAFFVPKSGQPTKLVHRIEEGALDHLPGEKIVYLPWQQFEQGITTLVGDAKKVAMEYSARNGNPYVSRVDGGTIDVVRDLGVEIVSSGDLVQRFEATLDNEQWQSHFEADKNTQAAFDVAWKFIADEIRSKGSVGEFTVQQRIVEHFESCEMTTYHPPIVGVGPNSGDPHYAPMEDKHDVIHEGDFVLIDLWAKMKKPRSIYSDLTKVGFVGSEVPDKYDEIFTIVAAARDAGIACVQDAFAEGRSLQGWEVDEATRKVIVDAGYGDYFVHRTGHSIGQETHGNGANMDNLETREDRRVISRTCFSIEPGIYQDEFGVRSEINVIIDADNSVHVTGGLQSSVLPIYQ